MQRRFDVGSRVYSSQFGTGEVIAVTGIGEAERLTISFDAAGIREMLTATCILEKDESRQIVEEAGSDVFPPAPAVTVEMIRDALREVLREERGATEVKMMDRWRGGTMTLKPGREGMKDKEIPLDDFFHKIVMVRDRLRVLEQKLNAHAGLSDPDKVELQQFITRIYGTLTTFNALFADRDDWFVGQRSDGA